jgi:ariadne-1
MTFLSPFSFHFISGNWTDHGQGTGGYYKCNRYDQAKPDSSSSAAQKAKAELDRYLHYYQRFHGHDSALKFASGQREAAERRMLERQETHRSTWIDVQFLKQAAEQVIDCRRVLKYTYVMGYFLEDASPEKQLFEHHQEMLEKNTERLHEYTEQPLDAIDRTQVVNLTRVTERFMASLLSTMAGGVVDVNSHTQSSSSSSSSSAAAGAEIAASDTATAAGKAKGKGSKPAEKFIWNNRIDDP